MLTDIELAAKREVCDVSRPLLVHLPGVHELFCIHGRRQVNCQGIWQNADTGKLLE